MIDPSPHFHLLEPVRKLVAKAGREIMRVYDGPDIAVRAKDDSSPVTEADEAANALIVAGLRALTPDIPVVSEEEAASHATSPGRRFWLVDPLDGTREFLKRNGEFTVNVGLIEDGVPVLGVVLAPALDALYWGAGLGSAGCRIADEAPHFMEARSPNPQGLDVVSSRSHRDKAEVDAYLARHKVHSDRPVGSSLKLCLVAAGLADLYPRFGRTMEWDIAAGHAVLLAAGGSVDLIQGGPLLYAKPGFENPAFLAWGRRCS